MPQNNMQHADKVTSDAHSGFRSPVDKRCSLHDLECRNSCLHAERSDQCHEHHGPQEHALICVEHAVGKVTLAFTLDDNLRVETVSSNGWQ